VPVTGSRWLSLVVLIVALVVVAAGAFLFGRSTADASASADPTKPSWLFSQTAGSGSVAPNGDGTFTLTLNEVDPNVVAFTDRPDRQSVMGRVENLVRFWPQLFKESAPNGVLVAHNAADATDSAVLELMDPAIKGSTLTFKVRVLENEGGPASGDARYDFEKVSLFIDDVQAYYACMTPNLEAEVDPPGVVEAVPSKVELAAFEKTCKDNGGLVNLV